MPLPIAAGVSSPIGSIWDAISGTASNIADGVAFASDPLGWTVGKLQDGVVGLTDVVIPALMNATKPDLSAQWFQNAYAVSFGIGIMLWLVLLIFQALRTARGAGSGFDLMDSLTTQSGSFIVGAMYGPAVGWVLVNFFHALADGILSGLFATSSADALTSFRSMVADTDWGGAAGGLVVALFLLFAMLCALILVVASLIVAMVALYMTGAIFPIAWAWRVDGERKWIADKILWTWLGVNAANPLMVLMLGIAFTMIAGSTSFLDSPSLKSLANMIAAVIVLIMAALSPALLLKFAPVMPTGAGQAMPSFSGGLSAPGMASPGQAADSQAGMQDDAGGEGGVVGATGAGAGGGGAEPGPGPLEAAAAQSQAGEAPGAGGATGTAPAGGAGGAPATEAGAVQEAGAGAANEGAGGEPDSSPLGASSPFAASSGSPSGPEGAEGSSSGAASASAAAEATGAAGAAETSTGAGAAIGIPTLVAAGAMAAASKGIDAATTGGHMAVADVSDQAGEQ